MILADYRTRVRDALGAAVDLAAWTDAVIDEALRSALQEFAERGPTVEGTLTAAEGYEQDAGGLDADLFNVEQLAWPWEEDTNQACDWATPFRMADGLLLRLETTIPPALGDLIRVIYRKFWYIQNLDSASETTVNNRYARIITVLAAYHACALRVRQVGAAPVSITKQIDDTENITNGTETTTVAADGVETITTVYGAQTKSTSSGDEVVTTSANSNVFPPVPAQTVTTDVPTVTEQHNSYSDVVETDRPTVTTTKVIPNVERSASKVIDDWLPIPATVGALEKAMAYFRAEADRRLAAIGSNRTAYANPAWSRIGL